MKEGPLKRGPSSSEPAAKVPTEAGSSKQAIQQTVSDLLKSLNIPSTEGSRAAAMALLDYGLPVTPENIDALLNLNITPRMGVLFMNLGLLGDTAQIENIIGLGNQFLMTGSNLSELLSLLEGLWNAPEGNSEMKGQLETLLASLKASIVPIDQMLSGENLGEAVRSLVQATNIERGIETLFSLDRMTFMNEPALLSIIEEAGALATMIEKQFGKESGKRISDRLLSITDKLAKALLGQTLTKIHLMQSAKNADDLLFAPIEWRGEPGTLLMSTDREPSGGGKEGETESHTTTFLLFLESLGRVKSRIGVLDKKVSCHFACEFPDLVDEIQSRSNELLQSLEDQELKLVEFTSITVPSENADLFFSPLAMVSEPSATGQWPISRINIKA